MAATVIKRLAAMLLILSTTNCATIHRHPRTFALIGGAAVGAVIVTTTMQPPSCHEYPPGKNGVGVPCPKD